MRSVLVTGGAGYIGSHTCKALASAGFLPVTYDDLVTGSRAVVRWGPFEYGDILDATRLTEVMARHRPVGILHFAAFADVGESAVDPLRYYRNNVSGTVTLLQAARDFGIDAVVFSSSCAVYGDPAAQPVDETAQIAPISPYGTTKAVVERVLADTEAAGGGRWMALRYFNAAGADPDGEIGELHSAGVRIVPLAIRAALGRRPSLTLNGDDYPTPDGTCVRDYVHVADLAEAHVRALSALIAGASSRAFNLGTGRGHSIREVIAAVERATGRKVPLVVGPRRPGDPPALWADATRARAELGWRPTYPELDDIVRHAAAWHTASPDR